MYGSNKFPATVDRRFDDSATDAEYSNTGRDLVHWPRGWWLGVGLLVTAVIWGVFFVGCTSWLP